LAYLLYNCIYAATAYPVGILADRWGFRKTLVCGIFLFVVVYTGFAFNTSTTGVFALFAVYGLYAAATEGISKAWISSLVPLHQTGTAIGLYTSCQSTCTLLASTIAGLLWTASGAGATFLTGAALAAIAMIRLLAFSADRKKKGI